jgi:hypothetical protein
VKAFNIEINLPVINSKEEVMSVLSAYGGSDGEKERISQLANNIPIKSLLMMLEMAGQMNNGELTFEDFTTAFDYFSNSY